MPVPVLACCIAPGAPCSSGQEESSLPCPASLSVYTASSNGGSSAVWPASR